MGAGGAGKPEAKLGSQAFEWGGSAIERSVFLGQIVRAYLEHNV